MRNISSIPGLVAAAAVLACLGCGGVVESDDRQLWTVSGGPEQSDPSVPSAAAPTAAGAAGGVAHGKLRSSLSPSARADICISADPEGRIEAIDEHRCEPLTDDFMGPRARCAGCEMSYLQARDGRRMLTARGAPGSCSVFAGTYLLDQDPQACKAEVGAREPGCPDDQWWPCEE